MLRALLIDLSGTLHIDTTPTPGAVQALERLRRSGILVRFCSNTTKESRPSLLKKLHAMGMDVRADELVTSLSALRQYIDKERLNPLYMLSESALQDFEPSKEPHDSVAIGLAPDRLNYAELDKAFRLLKKETPSSREPVLLATHKALYYQAKDGKLSLGPGPFIKALEEASGVTAHVLGKPTRAFFEMSLASLPGIDPGDIGMIGDDWRQDVAPVVKELGLKRFLVQTGKYRAGDEDLMAREPTGGPDWTGPSFAAAVDYILKE